jgi:hypothetical protein
MSEPLKVIARDAEDLTVVAACLQDALIPLTEMRYLAAERRFIMVANRFRWERASEGPAPTPSPSVDAPFDSTDDFGALQRVNTGICIDRVLAVRSRGIDQSRPDEFLSLLSLQLDGDKVNLLFAGGGTIQIDVEAVAIYVRDLGTAWPTQWQPDHAIDKVAG